MNIFKNNDYQLRSNRTVAFEGWGNLFFAVIGLVFFLLGTGIFKFKDLQDDEFFKLIALTLGVTFLSNSIYNFFRFLFVSDDENILYRKTITLFNQNSMEKKYGLINIFKKNKEAVSVIFSELNEISQIRNSFNREKFLCDIICNGDVAGFTGEDELNNNKDTLLNYLQKGFSIRMIISNYKLNHLAQLYVDTTFSLETNAIDSNFKPAHTKFEEGIKELIGSFEEIMRHPEMRRGNIGKIEIKFTNCLPVLQYHRVGDKVFVSSRMIGNEYTSEPIIHEYEKTNDKNDAFHLYEGFFNSLWENPKFSWYNKNLSFLSNGVLLRPR